MNQTDDAGLVGRMHAYVQLAEKEITKRKRECKLLEDELDTSRRLLQSLRNKLEESEALVKRQQQVKRVSQFKMQKLESGGRIQVRMATNTMSCQRTGCCRVERLYLRDGGYEEVMKECHSVSLRQKVFLEERALTGGVV